MLFNSMEYAIFLPIVFFLFWICKDKYRWVILLIASYVFYMCWSIPLGLLFLFVTMVAYAGALVLERVKKPKIILSTTIIICIGILFFFKYFNFFQENVKNLARVLRISYNPWMAKVVLPVGISFYTFQAVGYVIDVYRGEVEAEKHFGKFAAFLAFFPQLVAGPIERAGHLLPQIKQKHIFSYEQASYGIKLMGIGYFKKVIIADRLASYVDLMHNDMKNIPGGGMMIATIFFTIQIYCDFSGYSDIARGTAKLFGIELMENFKSPYFSVSIKDFWRRWHISLSSWLKDYIYIPLGGSKRGKAKYWRNTLITFMASGLWHGASWNYVLWGSVNGVGQIGEDVLGIQIKKRSETRIKYWVSVLGTFFIVNLFWVIFRAENISEVIYVYTNMFKGIWEPIKYVKQAKSSLGITIREAGVIGFSVMMLFLYDYASLKNDMIEKIGNMSFFKRWIIYGLFGLVTILLLPVTKNQQFIYFQF